jgi:hypothetical protein
VRRHYQTAHQPHTRPLRSNKTRAISPVAEALSASSPKRSSCSTNASLWQQRPASPVGLLFYKIDKAVPPLPFAAPAKRTEQMPARPEVTQTPVRRVVMVLHRPARTIQIRHLVNALKKGPVSCLRVPPDRDHRFHGNVITDSTPS